MSTEAMRGRLDGFVTTLLVKMVPLVVRWRRRLYKEMLLSTEVVVMDGTKIPARVYPCFIHHADLILLYCNNEHRARTTFVANGDCWYSLLETLDTFFEQSNLTTSCGLQCRRTGSLVGHESAYKE
jgi:hypothetical protein